MNKETYFEARKLIDSEKDGEYEVNKIHVFEFKNDSLLDYFYNVIEDNDDYEGLYRDGFVFSFEDLYSIDVDRVLKFMEGRLREIREEGSEYEKGFLEDTEKKYRFLLRHKGYSFLIKERNVVEDGE